MEIVLALAIGVLTASGLWLIFRPRTFQVILGLSLLSYAVNLFILAAGRLRSDAPPIVGRDPASADPALYADPLP
ncbi:MAG: NADH-quinone oxidoreductase subunit K, partial [Burkholderiaceae bacterium]